MALVTLEGARALTMKIGEFAVSGQLPLILDRGRILTARRRATGWTEEDDQRLAHAAKMLEADFKAAVERGPSEEVDDDAFGAVSMAAIGLCWPREDPLGVPSLRALKYDVVAYGELVADHLVVERGYTVSELSPLGIELMNVIDASIPTKAEVEEVEDFSDGGTGGPTDSTSSSG